jgi:hypothetical protein
MKKIDIEKILVQENKIADEWKNAQVKSSFIKEGLNQLKQVFFKPKVTVDNLSMKEGLEEFAELQKKWAEEEEKNPTPRCEKSGNPCGTDTWMVGHSCPCNACQRWLETRIIREEE